MRNTKQFKFQCAAGLAALLFAVPLVYRSASAQTSAQSAANSLLIKRSQPRWRIKAICPLRFTTPISHLCGTCAQLTLPPGESLLRFMDIAASINPATVHFRSITEPAKLGVFEQDYEYDLLDPNKLLQKYVGREVTLVRAKFNSGTTEYDEVKATLLSLNGAPVWKIGNEIVTGLSYESIRYPELPDNLYERPTLLWTLQNTGARRHKVEASYLTSNLSWSADYVLNVGKDEASGDLDGWVTLVNHSGTAFKNAQLQLVAGDLHRVRDLPLNGRMAMGQAVTVTAEAPPVFQQETFF